MSPKKNQTYRARANVAPNGVALTYDQTAELEETDEVKAMVASGLLDVESKASTTGEGG